MKRYKHRNDSMNKLKIIELPVVQSEMIGAEMPNTGDGNGVRCLTILSTAIKYTVNLLPTLRGNCSGAAVQ